ncbi:methionine aminopeptidase (MAP) [Mycoplasmoides gallisepticum NC06_2006.080-5-2P]|uniref:type I methionyl aminopeptidase n=1 Tax=Mycoplasmoides gallisepticum TaxID=2096 RepID=UPI0002778CB7|nr:type I methionyl aminopeptidase [Mycoplasmoides gallisepticum]AFP79508.1 methionine aminopeptidase (MAP) [Mycoplasmoides gallisepticum NC06_2006.080-5-2P]
MIYIKNPNEIQKIKNAAQIYKKIVKQFNFDYIKNKSLKEIDQMLRDFVSQHHANSCYHGYLGFKGYHCLSLNQTIIHGLANDEIFTSKDKLTIDIGIELDNYYCDSAFTILGPDVNPRQKLLSEVTHNCIFELVKKIVPNQTTTNDLGIWTEEYAKKHGYSVIKDFGGHGCGIKIHEDPIILNYGTKKPGELLTPNMVICIEPMFFEKDNRYYIDLVDSWSVKPVNKNQYVCHWEHMVLIKEDQAEILTL